MDIKFSKRSEMGANIFTLLNQKRLQRIERGEKVYNLSIGTPDFPPAPHVMEAVSKAAQNPENYKYSLTELPELISAVQAWYDRRYGVSLTGEQITSVYGTQEGMAHIAMALCDVGETMLIPNPCYPIFETGPLLCGANVEYYNLDPQAGWAPDLEGIDPELAKKAKVIVVSFPSNPTCAVMPEGFFPRLIAFAKKYELIVIHDNAYSEIYFGEDVPTSFLDYEGAMDIGVEFNSLSKSYNLTGARISFLLGNEKIVQHFKAMRSQIDYGTFLPVQYGAIAALNGPQDYVAENRAEYRRRRDALCEGLESIGWHGAKSSGSMFVWVPLPRGYEDSDDFCMELVEKSGVICTPGSSFASEGKKYVRFALTMPCPQLKKAVQAIGTCGMIKK